MIEIQYCQTGHTGYSKVPAFRHFSEIRGPQLRTSRGVVQDRPEESCRALCLDLCTHRQQGSPRWVFSEVRTGIQARPTQLNGRLSRRSHEFPLVSLWSKLSVSRILSKTGSTADGPEFEAPASGRDALPLGGSTANDHALPEDRAPSAPYRRQPRVFYSTKGERFLMQAGETMLICELPEGTRVIYPGVRGNGTNDPAQMRAMVAEALSNPIGQPPLREKLRGLKERTSSPRVLIAFDDVSLPLPPMRSPDLRQLIMEEAEATCVSEGVDDITFVCSIALHRYIRPDEFRAICGPHLYGKYFPHRMKNYNAVDRDESVHIGYTRHGEDVEVNKEFAEADLVIYANINYVAMDGGYKSYATGLVHYNSLKHNHDSTTLRNTRSLYDPPNSQMHKSFYRIGRVMQKHTDVFHVESVLDEQLFPFYLDFVTVLMREMNPLEKFLAYATVLSLKLLPVWIRMPIFWATRGPFGLLQVVAGETQAVHERTLACNYEGKIIDVDGQADILILAPSCLGPYTKDMYTNPLLANTYALGYWFNMYVGGKSVLRDGGVVIVVNEMHYQWSSPAHDAYRELFERVIAVAPGLDEFEAFQEEFVGNERLNDIYRRGLGPAAVHGFYMYTWAAHGMDKVSKVFVVGATDPRGPEILRWQMAPSVIDAVKQAREFLGDPDASVTFWQCPPVGYVRVRTPQGEAAPA